MFHTDLIWLYFGILGLWRAGTTIEQGGGLGDAGLAVLPVALCAGLVVGMRRDGLRPPNCPLLRTI